jgi:hypothetical protein
MERKKVRTLEVEYEKLLQDYIKKSLRERKKSFHSDLETFESYSARVEKEIRDEFRAFHEHFLAGFEVLKNQLQKK